VRFSLDVHCAFHVNSTDEKDINAAIDFEKDILVNSFIKKLNTPWRNWGYEEKFSDKICLSEGHEALLERSSYEVYCLDYGIFKTIYK
jgi:hypothetical protein